MTSGCIILHTVMKRKQYLLLILISVFSVAHAWGSQTVMTTQRGAFDLSPTFSTIAQHLYGNLNFSPLFLTDNLLNPKKMRELLLNPHIAGGTPVTVTTSDGEQIACTFFDRNSDKLLIIGTGFGNEQEKVAPLVHIFDKMNVVIFSYRGHGINEKKIIDTTQWKVKPTNKIKGYLEQLAPFINWNRVPNINLSKTTLGKKEEQDILAVTNHFSQQRIAQKQKYQKKFAMFFCFSSYVGSKIASQYPGLFDKIIFDSSMHAPHEIIDRVASKPQLLFDPQRASWDSVIAVKKASVSVRELLQENIFTKTIVNFLKSVLPKRSGTEKTTANYLSKIKVPILFFHGKMDKMTPLESDFKKNWDAVESTEKLAVIFDDTKHLTSCIKHKELYKFIATMFFEQSHDEFVDCLENPKNAVQYIQADLSRKLNEVENNIINPQDRENLS